MQKPEEIYNYCFFRLEDLSAVPSSVFEAVQAKLTIAVNSANPDQYELWRYLTQPMLDPKSLCAFFEWYFNNITMEKMDAMCLQDCEMLAPENLPKHLQNFESRYFLGARRVGRHFLTQEKYLQVRNYVEEHQSNLPPAVYLIENGIKTYLAALGVNVVPSHTNNLGVPLKVREAVELAYKKALSGSRAGSMIHEFLPAILKPIFQRNDSVTSDALKKGIRSTFRPVSVFDSTKVLADGFQGYKDDRVCPMKQAIAHLMNMSFECGEGGQFTRGAPQSGGLVLFSLDFYEGYLQQRGNVELRRAPMMHKT